MSHTEAKPTMWLVCLIRAIAVQSLYSWGPNVYNFSSCRQLRLWSDWGLIPKLIWDCWMQSQNVLICQATANMYMYFASNSPRPLAWPPMQLRWQLCRDTLWLVLSRNLTGSLAGKEAVSPSGRDQQDRVSIIWASLQQSLSSGCPTRSVTIYVAKTKALISCTVTVQLICVSVFAYAKSRFSHDPVHFQVMSYHSQSRRSP